MSNCVSKHVLIHGCIYRLSFSTCVLTFYAVVSSEIHSELHTDTHEKSHTLIVNVPYADTPFNGPLGSSDITNINHIYSFNASISIDFFNIGQVGCVGEELQ